MHVIGTAGHVDHGKSTLVRALTGMDPDRFVEEKRRGLTIDLGFAWCDLPSGREIGLVDVPGHERFIRNMLAGVGAVDAALFVVAADEGWMPQSTEHLQILEFLDIHNGLIAVTKSDAVDEELLGLVTEDVRERTRDTVLHDAQVVPVSAATAAGVPDVAKALDTLLEEVAEAADRGRPRLFVDRSFTITGAGTVVTGTLTGGAVRVGDEMEVLPSGVHARVRSLQTHRRSVQTAVPGSRVAVNLTGLEKEELRRGHALVAPGAWRTTDMFAARLRTSRDLRHPVGERGAYELYVGSAETPCRMKFIEEAPGREGRYPALPPDTGLFVQVFCMRALPLEPGDRFIIRDIGRWETVAGGVVLDHFPGRIRRGDPAGIERLRQREAAAGTDLVAQILAERKLIGRDELALLAGIGRAEADERIARSTAAERAVATAGSVLDAAHAGELERRAADTVAAYHAGHHLEAGMPREALRSALALDPKPFGELVSLWSEHGTLVAEGTSLRLPQHESTLTPEDRAAADAAIERLRAAGTSPPDAAELGLTPELLKALERLGEIVLVSRNLAYAADVMSDIERRVVRLIAEEGPVTVARFRDAIGTSRKYAVPLLEHLDDARVTRRQGDERALGPRGQTIAEELGGR